MHKTQNRQSVLIKAIAIFLVCLFTVDTLSWPNSCRGMDVRNDTLAVWTKFQPLMDAGVNPELISSLLDAGIEPDLETCFEIMAGARLLLKGKTFSAVNGMLIEKKAMAPGDGKVK
jgi:hypothetical protein